MDQELANTHDRTKCPNCENCITNLRKDVTRLRAIIASKDEAIQELTRVQSELCPVCSAENSWLDGPSAKRKTCSRCNASFDFVDGKPNPNSIAAAPVWKWRQAWFELIMAEREAKNEEVAEYKKSFEGLQKRMNTSLDEFAHAIRRNDSLFLIIDDLEKRLAAKSEEIKRLNALIVSLSTALEPFMWKLYKYEVDGITNAKAAIEELQKAPN